MSIKPGIRLGDRYQLLAPIATGGMGQVWRAEDTTLHRVVAAKILRSEFTGDEKFLARFRAEARNTASLSHPNIASVYDYGEQVHETERLCYLVMELVEGRPLVDILARERRLSPDRTLDYLEQTAMGLAAAHRQDIVHRDIKPGNLIIRPDGVLKITDFGIARAANSVALTERGTVVGTAQYLAPEQAEGQPAWPASDIYALGVVGYECLAGFRPFDGDNSVAIALAQIRETPRPLPADVPPNVGLLIEMTMRKNPNARYQDGTAFIPVVRAVRAGRMPPPPVIRGPQTLQPGTGAPVAAQGPPPARLPGQAAAPPPSPPGAQALRPGYPAVSPAHGSTQPAPAGHGAAPPPPRPAPAPTAQGPAAGTRAPQAPPPQASPAQAPAPSGTGAYATLPAPGGTGSYAQPVASRSGTYPAPPAAQGGTGSYPTGAGQVPPGAASGPGPRGRTVAWFWITLGLLLIAAIVAVIAVLITESDDGELIGSPFMTITETDLKEDPR